MDSTLKIKCSCGKTLNVPQAAIGRKIKCPNCEERIKVNGNRFESLNDDMEMNVSGIEEAGFPMQPEFADSSLEMAVSKSKTEETFPQMALTSEIAQSNNTASEMIGLENEVSETSKGISTLLSKRNILIALGSIAALLVVGWFMGFFSTQNPQERSLTNPNQTMAEMIAETNARKVKMHEEMLALEQKMATENFKREQRAELERARTELEFKKKSFERELLAQKKEQEQQKINFERKMNSKPQNTRSAIDRKKIADRLFSSIELDSSKIVVLSNSLQKINASIELRGKDFTEIKKFHQKKDWLSLVNLLLERNDDELPPASVLEMAQKKLLYKEFFMLLKVDKEVLLKQYKRSSLHLVHFPMQLDRFYQSALVLSSQMWLKHPDGIGYLHKWSPKDGQSIIVVANASVIYKSVNQLNTEFFKSLNAWKTRVKLGELDEATLETYKIVAAKNSYDHVVRWAKNQ